MRNPNVYCSVHKVPHLDPTLIQSNVVQAFLAYFPILKK
jgi:hypothetical protein